MQYEGMLYRALNPVFAREPLSGRGAALYGGRFNCKGVPALYTLLSIMTALREANQVGSLQPTTLIAYEAQIEKVFDGSNPQALQEAGIDEAALSDPGWRDQMRSKGEARTQEFARQLAEEGYHGLLVPSFAKGATKADRNLVLWQWSNQFPCRLIPVDDETRLSRL